MQDRTKNKVYVAGAFDNKHRINEIQNLLKTKGYEITHDWTLSKENLVQEGYKEQRRLDAINDLQGVLHADIVVCVFENPTYSYRGTCVEMGIALGLRKDIIALFLPWISSSMDESSTYRRNPFLYLDQVRRVEGMEEFVRII